MVNVDVCKTTYTFCNSNTNDIKNSLCNSLNETFVHVNLIVRRKTNVFFSFFDFFKNIDILLGPYVVHQIILHRKFCINKHTAMRRMFGHWVVFFMHC